jgi:hypothetical protein
MDPGAVVWRENLLAPGLQTTSFSSASPVATGVPNLPELFISLSPSAQAYISDQSAMPILCRGAGIRIVQATGPAGYFSSALGQYDASSNTSVTFELEGSVNHLVYAGAGTPLRTNVFFGISPRANPTGVTESCWIGRDFGTTHWYLSVNGATAPFGAGYDATVGVPQTIRLEINGPDNATRAYVNDALAASLSSIPTGTDINSAWYVVMGAGSVASGLLGSNQPAETVFGPFTTRVNRR